MADDPIPPVEGQPAGDPASDGSEETESSSDESIQSVLLFHQEEPLYPDGLSDFKLEDLDLSNEKLDYVDRVKSALGENSNKYSTFHNLLLQLETRRIGSLLFRRWARRLLTDHTELIMGLNIFLPREIHITEPSPTEYAYEWYRDFIKLVQKRYTDYEQRLCTFELINKDSKENKITDSQAIFRISHLFGDAPELVGEFKMPPPQ